MLGAGNRSERIVITREGQSTPDGFGGYVPGASTTVLDTYAQVKDIKAGLDVIAAYPDMVGVYEFKMLYRQDIEIRSTDTIEWRGRTFEIISLNPDFVHKEKITILGKTSNKSTLNNV